jgi:hypothetical protein
MGFGAFAKMEKQTIETPAAASFKVFLLKTQPKLPTDVFDVLRVNPVWDLQRLLKVTREACPDFYYAKQPPLSLKGQHVMRRLWADYLRETTPKPPSQGQIET